MDVRTFDILYLMIMKEIARLFGSDVEPILLKGGRGNTYRSDKIVLKPSNNLTESEEVSELISKISSSDKLRIPKSIKSINGNWIEDGYVAWEFLTGKDLNDNYKEKLRACDWFSDIFENIEKPNFIENRNDAWSVADRVTWGEKEKEYMPEFQEMIDQVQKSLIPIEHSGQIIHGDISGNIVFDIKEGLGVIDITLGWRPKDYAKALLIIDAITWEGADLSIYNHVKDLPNIRQLLLRAGLRRIIENPEHTERSWKDKERASRDATKSFQTLKLLNLI